MDLAIRRRDPGPWVKADGRFHRILVDPCQAERHGIDVGAVVLVRARCP